MKNELHTDNVYAFNIKGVEKHISKVERGRKGYYCMGCKAEVEARKGEIRSHYFAHVPTDVKIERKCTFSDETYRHKLAKEILQRIKKIKVPTLYKFPPKGVEGKPQKIKDSWTISAETVRIERQFYENEEGEIKFGKNINFKKEKNKFLLIQPDVAFFDKDDNPILLIEIVATHKIDAEKLSKIKRLGIDTVQVTIPKDSPEGIENCFFRTHRTQWIYNYEQETTNYISVPKRNNEGILSSDEFQKRLFRTVESFSCRSSQIKNLIRGIRKCLESKQYRNIEESIRREIKRVKENSERNRDRLRGIQKKYRTGIEESFKDEKESIEKAGDLLREKEKEFQKHFNDLEERYFRKRRSIQESQENYQPNCQPEIDRIERDLEESEKNSASYKEQMEEIRRLEEEFEQFFRREERRITKDTRKEKSIVDDYKRRREELPEEYETTESNIRGEFELAKEKAGIEFREDEERIRREFDEFRKQVIESIENRISTGESRIHRRIKDTLDKGKLLHSIREGQGSIRTLKEIKEFFDSGAYKDWI